MRTAAFAITAMFTTSAFAAPPAASDKAKTKAQAKAETAAKDKPQDNKEKPPRKLTFDPGIQVFLRGEGRVNPDFAAGTGAPDQGTVLERVRLQARGTWGPLSLFAQVQDARSWGFEPSTTSNTANTDLHQGYLEIKGKHKELEGFVRVGRQEISMGKQRLIGALAWMPNARSFDALTLGGKSGKFSGEFFGVMLAPPSQVTADNADPTLPPTRANSSGAQLGGLRFGAKLHKAANVEVHGLAIREDAKTNALAFDRRIGNAGARVWGSPVAGLRYDVEGNYQFGNFNDRKHAAWAWAATLGYTYDKDKDAVKPGLHVGYAMASGETCTAAPSDGVGCGAAESNEFFNFFPTNHLYYGALDLMGWRNMRDLEAGISLALPPVLAKLGVNYHLLQLNDPKGRWSSAGGANVGAGWDPTNDDRSLGHEIDFFAVIKPWKPMMIQPGYGVFLPTGAGRVLGGAASQHYAWLWWVVTLP